MNDTTSNLFPEITPEARPVNPLREPIEPEAMPIVVWGMMDKLVIAGASEKNPFATGQVIHKGEPFDRQLDDLLSLQTLDIAPALLFFKDIIRLMHTSGMMKAVLS